MKAYLQYWEESERKWGVRPDGSSLHLSLLEHQNYVDKIYHERTFHQHVPDEYDKTVGEPIEIELDEDLSQKLSEKVNLRLTEVETRNLIQFKQIIL